MLTIALALLLTLCKWYRPLCISTQWLGTTSSTSLSTWVGRGRCVRREGQRQAKHSGTTSLVGNSFTINGNSQGVWNFTHTTMCVYMYQLNGRDCIRFSNSTQWNCCKGARDYLTKFQEGNEIEDQKLACFRYKDSTGTTFIYTIEGNPFTITLCNTKK